jgi:hypothetical protein
MTQLTITSAPGMGPLEVSVYPPDGSGRVYAVLGPDCQIAAR